MPDFFRPYRLKTIYILLFYCSFCNCQENIFNRTISFSCDSCSVQDAFEKIEDEINYYFSYNTGLFPENKKISAFFENEKLSVILEGILDDSTLNYTVVEKQIVIFRKQPVKDKPVKAINDTLIFPIYLSGQISDAVTGEPVSFANVSVFGKPFGTVANIEGEFILKLPSFFIDNEIAISCIGYNTLSMSVNEMLQKQDFLLEMEYVPIQEVIIRNTDPVNLIKNALNRLPQNYSQKQVVLTSFYRETIKKGDEFIGVTEAVLQTYKQAYNKTYQPDRIKLIKGRRTINVHPHDTVIIKLKAGLNTTLLLDLIKNPAEFLQAEYFDLYKYRLTDIIIDDDEETYVIDFKQKDVVKEPLYYGKIYLNVKDLGFKGVDFALNETGIEKAWDRFVIKKPLWLKVKPVKAAYSVYYKKYENKYYVNSIRAETVFRIKNRKKIFTNEFSSKIEMAVTQIDTTHNEPVRSRDALNTESILIEEFTAESDVFWSDYNYIKPDEPLEEAIKELITKD